MIRRLGAGRVLAAGVCSALFAALLIGLAGLAIHSRWALFASGLVTVALWGWITWSLWSPDPAALGAAPADHDPGWPLRAGVLLALLPGAIFLLAQPRSSNDGLRTMRAVMIAFTAALVLFGDVLARLALPSGPAVPWVPLLAVVALPSLFVDRMQRARIDCSSAQQLSLTYRAGFFLHLTFAISIALFAFTLAFIGPGWIYYPAAAVAILRLWTGSTVTPRALAHEQARLQARGCNLSLIAALRTGGRPA